MFERVERTFESFLAPFVTGESAYSIVKTACRSSQALSGQEEGKKRALHIKGKIAHKSLNESMMKYVSPSRKLRPCRDLWPIRARCRFPGIICAYLWDISDIGPGQAPGGAEMAWIHSLRFHFLRLPAPDCRAR